MAEFFEWGGDDYLELPLKTSKLKERLHVAIRIVKKFHKNANQDPIFPSNAISQKNSPILIVDDCTTTRSLIKKYLHHWNYDYLEANDGNQAWDIMQQKEYPKLIILDIMMPGIDGFTLLKQIKEDTVLNNIPVFVISGKIFPPERKQAINMGATAFFTKPIMGKELVEEISKYV